MEKLKHKLISNLLESNVNIILNSEIQDLNDLKPNYDFVINTTYIDPNLSLSTNLEFKWEMCLLIKLYSNLFILY